MPTLVPQFPTLPSSDSVTGTLASIYYGFYTKIIQENIFFDLKVYFLPLISKEIQTFLLAPKILWVLGTAKYLMDKSSQIQICLNRPLCFPLSNAASPSQKGVGSAASHRLRTRAELVLRGKGAPGRSLCSRWALLPDLLKPLLAKVFLGGGCLLPLTVFQDSPHASLQL